MSGCHLYFVINEIITICCRIFLCKFVYFFSNKCQGVARK
jgi:hypothetical protein